MAVIRIEGLTKDYGHQRGVFDVSFRVREGEVYGFLGPNGAGKTTTIRHIMGFQRPQAGKVVVQGLDSWRHAAEIQRNLGYLPGELALPETMSGKEFIQMMASLRGLRDLTYTRELLEKFDLDPVGSLKRMSLGMKRKLAIVAAIMHDPAVLVLDEPTSGLDPMMQQTFIEFIKDEKARGKTILLSSHMFKEVEAACDTISIIKDGRLVSTFKAEDLRNWQDKTYEMEFISTEEFKRFAAAATSHDAFDVELYPHKKQAVVKVHDSAINTFIAWIADYELKFFSEIKFTLEDYFMKFYDRNEEHHGGGIDRGHH